MGETRVGEHALMKQSRRGPVLLYVAEIEATGEWRPETSDQ